VAGKEGLKSFGAGCDLELKPPFLSRVKSRLLAAIFLPVRDSHDPNFAATVA
jgi:hypothetical protein